MAKTKAKQPTSSKKVASRPAISEEAREKQCIAYAYDLVEQRLRDGTASAQETVHFLKLGTSEAKLKLRILEKEEELVEAKTDKLKSDQKVEELYANALTAMRRYSGNIHDDC